MTSFGSPNTNKSSTPLRSNDVKGETVKSSGQNSTYSKLYVTQYSNGVEKVKKHCCKAIKNTKELVSHIESSAKLKGMKAWFVYIDGSGNYLTLDRRKLCTKPKAKASTKKSKRVTTGSNTSRTVAMPSAGMIKTK